jgi:hypothetical protein
MADYINIYGQDILAVASDPANPTVGQIWYNTTSNTLKGEGYAAGSWATSNNMNTARQVLAGAGTQTSGLAFGGYTTAHTGATEEYDGSSWTSNPTGLNTARSDLAGCGTQTAALAFSGESPGGLSTATEEYDGSTWTSNPTGINTARQLLAGCGTQTAALGFGGSAPALTGATEEYDGSTWTTSPGSLNTARTDLAGCGTQTCCV